MKDDNVYSDEQNFKQQPIPNEPQAGPIDLSETTSSTPLIPQPQNGPFNSNANIDKKIKFWKRFSLALGLITFFGYILFLISANILAHGTQFGWVIFMMFGMARYYLIFVLMILSLISFIRVIVLSKRRKRHAFKDYAMAAIGLLLIFSPYAISGVLSFFRISWNEDNSVSVTLKSKDPYYLSGDSSWGALNCAKIQGTSNELKNVDIDSKYSYVSDSKRRELFAAERYVETIGEEILCQVGEFYRDNNRYPDENEIKTFSSKAANNDLRNGIYNIKLEVGAEPNDKDFTVLFNKNCTNKTTKDDNVVVLSPLYGDSGRYCVYNKIDEIIVEDF